MVPHVDQRLAITPELTPDDAAVTALRVKALTRAANHDRLLTGLTLEPGNSLPSTVHQLLARRGVARSTVEPAVLSLILVALVLLSRLLSAAMILRRGELALASLRGYDRRQLWFLGMLEPLLILAAATPVGTVLGYVTSRYLAGRWLVPGLPVPFILASGLAVVVVVLVTGVVAAVVVRDAVNEPLSSQIAGVRRPTRAGRGMVIVRLRWSPPRWPRWSPRGAGASRRLRTRPTWRCRCCSRSRWGCSAACSCWGWPGCGCGGRRVRRALSSYVASRTVRRRREGTLVILPVTAALTVAVFTVGVSLAASTWRASAAATEVGAPLSYPTSLSLSRAVGLTHEIDPEGRWLMAAAGTSPTPTRPA